MVHDKLSHLSPEEIVELVARYYAGDKVAKLIEDFRIDTRPGNLVSLFPPRVHQDLLCPYCEGQHLEQHLRSRDSFIQEVPHCPLCQHKYRSDCQCKNCRLKLEEERQKEESTKRNIIAQRYTVEAWIGPDLCDLTMRDAVFLLALYRHSVTEDLSSVDPFADRWPELAPTFELKIELVQHLYAKSLISPSVESEPAAFVFDDGCTDITAYYPGKVIWSFLPGMELDSKRNFIGMLADMSSSAADWPGDWYGQTRSLWLSIAKYECIEYYIHLLSQRNFEPETIGPKTHDVFGDLLQRFSVAQIYNLTWQAVRDTTDYIVREKIPLYRAKNSFIGAVQRKADKYIAEGWEVRNSRRDFDCPQSVLSATFFNVFVGLGERAFQTVLPDEV